MSERLDFAPFAWPAVAAELGFALDSAGAEAARDDLVLRPDGSWLTLLDRGPCSGSTEDLCGTPGLWKWRSCGSSAVRVFDLPPLELASSEDDDPDPDDPGQDRRPAFAELIAWAEATRGAKAPARWAPPEEELLDGIAAPRLAVRAGGSAAQGEIVRGPGRLAVVFPELVELPARLPTARSRWLHELCHDTEERWRLVRLRPDPGSGRVRAEVDLTGAPYGCARSLLLLSLEALSYAIEWLLPSLALVVDPTAESRALDREPRDH